MSSYWQDLVVGALAGLGPCMAGCAIILVPAVAAIQQDWLSRMRAVMAFSVARWAVYVLLGAAAGACGTLFTNLYNSTAFAAFARVLGGGLIVLIGAANACGQPLSLHLCGRRRSSRTLAGASCFWILGLFVGLSPCGPMLAVLTHICVRGAGPISGALTGLSFGLGTVLSPALAMSAIAVGAPSLLVRGLATSSCIRIGCGTLLMLIGAWNAVLGFSSVFA